MNQAPRMPMATAWDHLPACAHCASSALSFHGPMALLARSETSVERSCAVRLAMLMVVLLSLYLPVFDTSPA
jgi:hypothetical protein